MITSHEIKSTMKSPTSEEESENTKLNNNIKGYDGYEYLLKIPCWTFYDKEVII